jgi:hypothetical protein
LKNESVKGEGGAVMDRHVTLHLLWICVTIILKKRTRNYIFSSLRNPFLE